MEQVLADPRVRPAGRGRRRRRPGRGPAFVRLRRHPDPAGRPPRRGASSRTDRADMHPHPMFERILAGTDGTPRAEEAVRQAARLAAVTGAGLEVVFVAHPAVPGLGGVGAARLAEADAALERARRGRRGRRGRGGRPGAGGRACPHARGRGRAPVERPGVRGAGRRLRGEAPPAGRRGRAPRSSPGPSHPRGPPGRGRSAVVPLPDPGARRRFERVPGGRAAGRLDRAGRERGAAVPALGRGRRRPRRSGWTLEGHPTGFEPLEPAVELAAANRRQGGPGDGVRPARTGHRRGGGQLGRRSRRGRRPWEERPRASRSEA